MKLREIVIDNQRVTWTAFAILAMFTVEATSYISHTGEQRHDQKEFVWTLHKSRDDWESKIK